MSILETRIVPLISSGSAGPLGALHLPRLWLKLTLGARDLLAEDYAMCGAGFDQMTLTALGLDKDATIAFVSDKHPTYMQFEDFVVAQNGGSIAPEKIARHNAAILGYHHSDELAGSMRSESGIKGDAIKDAVTLNSMNDLDEIHRQIEGPH